MSNDDLRSKLAPSSNIIPIAVALGSDTLTFLGFPMPEVFKTFLAQREEKHKQQLARYFVELLRNDYFQTVQDINDSKIEPFLSAYFQIIESMKMGRQEEKIRHMVLVLNGYETADQVDPDEFAIIRQGIENLSKREIELLSKLYEAEELELKKHADEPKENDEGDVLTELRVRMRACSDIKNCLRNKECEERLGFTKYEFDLAMNYASSLGFALPYPGYGGTVYVTTPKLRRLVDLARRGAPSGSDQGGSM